MIIEKIILFVICFSFLSCSSGKKSDSEPAAPGTPKTEKLSFDYGTYGITIEAENLPTITCTEGKIELNSTMFSEHKVTSTGVGVTMYIYSDRYISFHGTISCTSLDKKLKKGTINLSQTFIHRFNSNDRDPSTLETNLPMKGIINRGLNVVKNSDGSLPKGGYIFTPPRPDNINALADINNIEALKTEYIEKSSVIVRTLDKKVEDEEGEEKILEGQTIEDQGVFGIQVLDIEDSTLSCRDQVLEFTVDGAKHSISNENNNVCVKYDYDQENKIIHSKIRVISGFDKIPQKGHFMLLDSKEMWIGMDSNDIYKMKIQSSVSDFTEGMSESLQSFIEAAGQDKITMTFTLKSFNVYGTL